MSWGMGNRAALDAKRYRDGYPDLTEQDEKRRNPSSVNLKFYLNKFTCKPLDVYIDDALKDWNGEYGFLERSHCFIQWLFPIREPGMNSRSRPLTLSEIVIMRDSVEVKDRILKSYKMMLDFYGMEFKDDDGNLKRTKNYKKRYANLNYSSHNYLRITRILKCLGEMQMDKYCKPFLKFVWDEISKGELVNCCESAFNYWNSVLRDDEDRGEIEQLSKKLFKKAKKEREKRWKRRWGRYNDSDSDDSDDSDDQKSNKKKKKKKKNKKKKTTLKTSDDDDDAGSDITIEKNSQQMDEEDPKKDFEKSYYD